MRSAKNTFPGLVSSTRAASDLSRHRIHAALGPWQRTAAAACRSRGEDLGGEAGGHCVPSLSHGRGLKAYLPISSTHVFNLDEMHART